MNRQHSDSAPSLPELIRRETDDGLLAVRFLTDLMDGQVEGAKITDRLAAARELLDRGFGKPNAASVASASGDDSDAEREAIARATLAERIRRALDAMPENDTPSPLMGEVPAKRGMGVKSPP